MALTAADIIRMVSGLTSRDRNLVAVAHGGSAVSEPLAMERSLTEAAAVLDRAGFPHALIGGPAVAVHTKLPRATLDVGFAVRSDIDREQVITFLLNSGFTLRGRFEHSVNLMDRLGNPVQLAFDPAFDGAITRADICPLAGATIRIVRREDLIELKERAAADPRRRRSRALRDQLDIEMLRGDVPDPDEGW